MSRKATMRLQSNMYSTRLFSQYIANEILTNSSTEDSDDIPQQLFLEDPNFMTHQIDEESSHNMLIDMDVQDCLCNIISLGYKDLETHAQKEILNCIEHIKFAPHVTITKKGSACSDIYILLSDNAVVTNIENGEKYSRGKILNMDYLAFGQNISPDTVVSDKSFVDAIRIRDTNFAKCKLIRSNFLKSRYTILDMISNDELDRIKFDHQWIEPCKRVNVDTQLALVTHGAVRHHHQRMFAGHVIGIEDFMQHWYDENRNRERSNEDENEFELEAERIITDCFTGIAFIDVDTFHNLMRTEKSFQAAMNDIALQHSVMEERDSWHSSSSPNSTAEEIRYEREHSCNRGDLVTISSTNILVKQLNAQNQLMINDYTVLERIGNGATGTIFTCHLKSTPDNIKIMKMVKKDKANESIMREIAALTVLKHDNIIELHGLINSSVYNVVIFIQELAEWGSLLNTVLKPVELRICLNEILAGLQYIHERGYIHGDIKPANILRKECGQVKIADFGCCTHITDTHRPTGTPSFMAPELFNTTLFHTIGFPIDVWAFAVTAYTLRNGHVPYSHTPSRSLRDSIFFDEVPLARSLSSLSIFGVDETIYFQKMIEDSLRKNSDLRPSVIQLRSYDYFRIHRPNTLRGSLSSSATSTSSPQTLKRFFVDKVAQMQM